MIVRLDNNEEIIISREQAEKIEAMMSQDIKHIKINKRLVRTSAIKEIKPGGYTEADVIDESKQLEPPDHRGQYSASKEKIRKWLKERKTSNG